MASEELNFVARFATTYMGLWKVEKKSVHWRSRTWNLGQVATTFVHCASLDDRFNIFASWLSRCFMSYREEWLNCTEWLGDIIWPCLLFLFLRFCAHNLWQHINILTRETFSGLSCYLSFTHSVICLLINIREMPSSSAQTVFSFLSVHTGMDAFSLNLEG